MFCLVTQSNESITDETIVIRRPQKRIHSRRCLRLRRRRRRRRRCHRRRSCLRLRSRLGRRRRPRRRRRCRL